MGDREKSTLNLLFRTLGFSAAPGVFAGELGLEFLRMPQKSDPDPVTPSEKTNPLASAARYSEMGFIIPAAVLLGFFLGKLADYWLHTKWIYLVGLLFGAVVGFGQMIRMAVGAFKKDD